MFSGSEANLRIRRTTALTDGQNAEAQDGAPPITINYPQNNFFPNNFFKNFRLFPKLPNEIQLMIWNLAAILLGKANVILEWPKKWNSIIAVGPVPAILHVRSLTLTVHLII
jgi:hypothetical protein